MALRYDNEMVTVGSAQIGYRREGRGSRQVLLLHGQNSHSGTWRKTIPALADDYSVFAPSLPPQTGVSLQVALESYTDCVTALTQKLGIRNAAVVGSSIGGWVAMRLASIKGAVSCLVLEGTAGTGSDDVRAVQGGGVKTLIIWGEDDAVISVSDGKTLHERLPESKLEVLPGVGHVPHWEKPESFNRLMVDFLR